MYTVNIYNYIQLYIYIYIVYIDICTCAKCLVCPKIELHPMWKRFHTGRVFRSFRWNWARRFFKTLTPPWDVDQQDAQVGKDAPPRPRGPEQHRSSSRKRSGFPGVKANIKDSRTIGEPSRTKGCHMMLHDHNLDHKGTKLYKYIVQWKIIPAVLSRCVSMQSMPLPNQETTTQQRSIMISSNMGTPSSHHCKPSFKMM